MSYGLVSDRHTNLGCRVVTIRTVKQDDNVLVPVEHIFLSCPDEEGVDKPNEVQ